VLIACDFDGTLAPIVAQPGEAALPPEVRGLLRKLQSMQGVTVAVISGRSVRDLRLRVGIDGVLYAGNHGLEIDAPGILWSSMEARAHRPELSAAIADLRHVTNEIPGVIIEDKQLTGTVHWRMVPPELITPLRGTVEAVTAQYPGLRLANGKAIWELRPRVEWNKGSALQSFLTRLHLEPADAIYIGDDETDEAAFHTVANGLSLRIGETPDTAAHYRLRDQQAAVAFLFCLLAARVAHRSSLSSARNARSRLMTTFQN
jgi:trehalose-phosphatase